MTSAIAAARPGRRWRLPAAVSLAVVTLGRAALAQETALPAEPPAQPPVQTPAQTSPSAPKAVEEVTVTATAPSAVRTSIDRRSYSVAGDLQGSTGSVSDALRNVPSVDVDVQGNLSLRGNGNVTVMIDGQKSTMFSGPGGAQALQSMSADQIERVEVITNPTAATSANGTAGIINLIMKKNRKPGLNGGVRANVGTGGRPNVAGNVIYTAGKLTLSADAGARRDPQSYREDTTSISTDPATGKVVTVQEPDFQTGRRDNWNGHVGAEYALDAKTRLSGDLRANGFVFPSELGIDSVTTTPGAPARVFSQRGEVHDDLSRVTGQATLHRTFAGDDHDLNVTLSRDVARYGEGDGFTETPALTPPFRDQHVRDTGDLTELKADYNKPVGKAGKLKTGYDLTVTDDGSNNDTTHGTGPADAVVDPQSKNLYHYRQTVNAAYATFEQPLGQWTILAGLRVEDEQLRLHEDIQNLTVSRDDLRLFPSLHLSWQATETQQWILSYTSRIQRPGPFQLDPFVNRFDPLNPGTGNPLLEPAVTQSFEGGWQYKKGSTSYLATLFYRNNMDEVNNVTIPQPDGVLLWTSGNVGSSINAGLELVASGPLLGKTLTYNVSTDIYWNDVRSPLFGVQQRESDVSATLRGSLDWQATKKDQFQINGQLSPRRLSPQGYNDPRFLLFLGYKHKFNDAWSAVVTVQDPFDIYRWRYGLDQPGLHRLTTGHANVQAAFFGFTYSFGGAKSAAKSDPGFDFNTGSAK